MGQNLWFRKTPLTNECGQDRRDQGKRQETPIRRPLEKGTEGRGEDLSWDSEESDQRGLAIQLELEAKEACISPPPHPRHRVAQEDLGIPPQTQSQEHADGPTLGHT